MECTVYTSDVKYSFRTWSSLIRPLHSRSCAKWTSFSTCRNISPDGGTRDEMTSLIREAPLTFANLRLLTSRRRAIIDNHIVKSVSAVQIKNTFCCRQKMLEYYHYVSTTVRLVLLKLWSRCHWRLRMEICGIESRGSVDQKILKSSKLGWMWHMPHFPQIGMCFPLSRLK